MKKQQPHVSSVINFALADILIRFLVFVAIIIDLVVGIKHV